MRRTEDYFTFEKNIFHLLVEEFKAIAILSKIHDQFEIQILTTIVHLNLRLGNSIVGD